jgi:hypothetical protein
MRTLYIRPMTRREVREALRRGWCRCCATHHGQNPPIIRFDENPAAMHSLIQRGWCVCERCYRRYLRNGNTRIVLVESAQQAAGQGLGRRGRRWPLPPSPPERR